MASTRPTAARPLAQPLNPPGCCSCQAPLWQLDMFIAFPLTLQLLCPLPLGLNSVLHEPRGWGPAAWAYCMPTRQEKRRQRVKTGGYMRRDKLLVPLHRPLGQRARRRWRLRRLHRHRMSRQRRRPSGRLQQAHQCPHICSLAIRANLPCQLLISGY